jgi:small subunit ribosomal protein S6
MRPMVAAPCEGVGRGLLLQCRGFLPRPARPFPGGVGSGEADSDRGKETREHVTEYEILLLLDPDLEEERQGEVVTRTRELVEKAGGSWDLHDVWGRRKLAYEIGHKGEGTYHLLQFTCEPSTLDEISRVLRIDDGVLRHMATRRIEGSPARPVAQSAPSREDAETAPLAQEQEE